ncbi:MAG: type IV secretory system conjugative DNA transfer family protein, partial [Planctomycetota bacterium]
DLRVTALIDEMASLGYMPNLLAAMNQYRKFGLRIVAALQDAYGQTEQNYGSSGVKQILGVSEFIWASNISEPNMLDMLSKMSGETTITDASLSDTQNPQHRDATSQQYSWSHKSRPLLRPDEIRRLPAHQVVLLGRNMPAGIINKTPYWTHPEWKQLAGPNPSHRE